MYNAKALINFPDSYIINPKIEVKNFNTWIIIPSDHVTLGERQGGIRGLFARAFTRNLVNDLAIKKLKAQPLAINWTMNSPPVMLSLAARGQPADDFLRPTVSIDILIGQSVISGVMGGETVPIQVEKGSGKRPQAKRAACMHSLPIVWAWPPGGQYCNKISPNVDETVFCSGTIHDIQNNMARLKGLKSIAPTKAWHADSCLFTPVEDFRKITTLMETGEPLAMKIRVLDQLENKGGYLLKRVINTGTGSHTNCVWEFESMSLF